MNLQHIMLSEISQPKEDKHVWFLLHEVLGIVQITEMESRMVVARDCGEWGVNV